MKKSIESYFEDWLHFCKIYWLTENGKSFFKIMVEKGFDNAAIKEFFKNLPEHHKHCLKDTSNKYWLWGYRGFNIHFRWMQPSHKHSASYVWYEDEGYSEHRYYYGCCIVTLCKYVDDTSFGHKKNKFLIEKIISTYPFISRKRMRALADTLITQYLKNESTS